MKVRNIIFDFDGTLADTRPGVVKSFKRTIRDLAGRETSKKEITELIGNPLAYILSKLLKTGNADIIEKGCELFGKYYEKEGLRHTVVYPSVKEMLRFFENQNIRLFVVSNKIELFMNKILEQNRIKKYFVFVTGTDGRDKKSKKPEYVKQIIEKYKLDKKETAIVGDTENDILAGKENLILTVGITWGYGLESNLVEAGADIICRNISELKQFIKK